MMGRIISVGLPAFVFAIISLRVLRYPRELAIYVLMLSSSFPVISSGDLLSYGSKGAAIRIEYMLFFWGVFLVILGRIPPTPKYTSRTRKAAFLVFLLHLFSAIVTLYWGNPFGVGVYLRLFESFAYFFIFIQLTRRDDISQLVDMFIFIAVIISAMMATVSITANRTLYDMLFNVGELSGSEEFSYRFFGTDLPRVWSAFLDQYLPLAGSMAFYLLLTKKKKGWFYALSIMLIFIRAILSGFRGSILFIAFGLLFMTVLYLLRREFKEPKSRGVLLLLLLVAIILVSIMFIPTLNERFDYFVDRMLDVPQELISERQYLGRLLAINALNRGGWLAWTFGLGGLLYQEIGFLKFDINTPILGIYRFGIIGIIIFVNICVSAFLTANILLRKVQLSHEETAVIGGVLIYICVTWLGSFIRGFELSENFQHLAGFVVLLSWMDVIFRDAQLVYNEKLTARLS